MVPECVVCIVVFVKSAVEQAVVAMTVAVVESTRRIRSERRRLMGMVRVWCRGSPRDTVLTSEARVRLATPCEPMARATVRLPVGVGVAGP